MPVPGTRQKRIGRLLGVALLLTKTQRDVYCYRDYHTSMGSVLVLRNGAKVIILVTRIVTRFYMYHSDDLVLHSDKKCIPWHTS